jgi:hypothetical protein
MTAIFIQVQWRWLSALAIWRKRNEHSCFRFTKLSTRRYPKLATIRERAATSMKRDGLLEERHWGSFKEFGN